MLSIQELLAHVLIRLRLFLTRNWGQFPINSKLIAKGIRRAIGLRYVVWGRLRIFHQGWSNIQQSTFKQFG